MCALCIVLVYLLIDPVVTQLLTTITTLYSLTISLLTLCTSAVGAACMHLPGRLELM